MSIIEKSYEQQSDKLLVDNLVEVLISDLHYTPKMCIKVLKDLMDYLEQNKDVIDFICIPGDLTSVKGYLNNKKYDSLKCFLREMSETINKPIFLSLGNHDIYHKFSENKDARMRFKDLSDDNIIALDNECYSYSDNINIIGLSGEFSKRANHTAFGCDSDSLMQTIISNFPDSFSNDKFNIALVHDPNAISMASYEFMDNNFFNIDQFLSGHLHGGYVKAKTLEQINSDSPKYGYGKKESFEAKILKMKIDNQCYGEYQISNTESKLFITEGIRRYNNVLPKRFYNNPFVAKINIHPKVLMKGK